MYESASNMFFERVFDGDISSAFLNVSVIVSFRMRISESALLNVSVFVNTFEFVLLNVIVFEFVRTPVFSR